MKSTHSQPDRDSLFRLAVEAAPSGIMIADAHGSILFANETLAKMFGYACSELVDEPVEILISPRDADFHRRRRGEFMEAPTPRRMGAGLDFEAIRKDGSGFPVEIGLQPLHTDEGSFVVATVIDITQRKSMENRLRRHEEKLEELVGERTRELREAQQEKDHVVERLVQAEKMSAIGTLVSGIGHEINNPLYVVLAFAEAIGAEQDVERCHEHGAEIVAHARHIAQIVKSLSAYARPAGAHDRELVDLNQSISRAKLLAERSVESDDVEIRLDPRPVPEILAKTDEIQQVIFNLIRNGVQASSANGIVKVATRCDDDWVSVSIRDRGSGIPKEDQRRIFDPFYTTKDPDQGDGLGLYVVQQIVKRHGGVIALDSQDGAGTTFVIKFPVPV